MYDAASSRVKVERELSFVQFSKLGCLLESIIVSSPLNLHYSRGKMDHDMPMPMPGHGDGMQCSMSMVWNTSTSGICIVFSSWQIQGPRSLALTLSALFLLAMLLEYLRLSIRSYDAHLLSTYYLSSGVLSALNASSTHRRKASIQQRRNLSTAGGAALLSSSLKPTLGERRSTTSGDSTTSSWGASDDDAPLLPAPNGNRQKKKSLAERFRLTFM